MKQKEKTIELTREILNFSNSDDIEIFDAISESLYDEILSSDGIPNLSSSAFGFVSDTFYTIVMTLIITATAQLSKEGIEMSKSALKVWLRENENRMLNQHGTNKLPFVIKILKDYLNEK